MQNGSNNYFSRVEIGSIPFEITNPGDAAQFVVDSALAQTPLPFRLANAYCIAAASKDTKYADLLRGPGINFPDGAPVAWAMRKLYRNNAHAVRGPSLFKAVLQLGRHYEIRHFLLGTTPETLQLLTDSIIDQMPGVTISGSFAPRFGPLNEEFYKTCETKIHDAAPDIVWVALGTPKQDFAALQLANSTGKPTVAVGAAFDFLAGTAREAPKWMHGSGLEWVFRLGTQPKRLWRRYLFGNIEFLQAVARHRNDGLRKQDQS